MQRLDEESLFLADFADTKEPEIVEIPQMRHEAPSDNLTPSEWVYRNANDQQQANWLQRHHYPTDLMRNFLAASNVSPMTGKGFVGLIRSFKERELIKWVVEVNKEFFNGRALKFVASMGEKLTPFPLLELHQAIDWLKENEADTYEEWRKGGMFTPAHVLDTRIGQEPFTLIANGDIVNILETTNLRAARSILGKLTATGCSVLLIYTEERSILELEQRGLFFGLKKFFLGEF